MCGVFGYVGKERNDLSSFLLQGLSKLDYRGYDSAGVAVLGKDKFSVVKSTGEVNNLKRKIGTKKYSGSVGIGHTRWATHGGVTVKNSHPHGDCTGRVVVVHNGIIENFEELKEGLQKGHKFSSDTDTEVVAHLIEEKLKNNEFRIAVKDVFKMLDGLNAIVAVNSEGELVAIRKGSPLVAGIKNGNKYVSSDIPALSDITNNMIFIDEDEGVYVNENEISRITLMDSKKHKVKIEKTKIKVNEVRKEGFKHFLLKEIFEQPEVIKNIYEKDKKEIDEATKIIKDAWGTYFTACGTAAHAGLAATYMFSEISKMHVNFSYGSEFPYYEDFLVDRSLLIAASQSGETMDTLEAVRAAKNHNSSILSLVNIPNSSLERLSDKVVYLDAGIERAVLSTKAYIAKLSVFLLLAYSIGGKYVEGNKTLKKAAKGVEEVLSKESLRNIKKISSKLKRVEHIYIIGRGLNYPTALEGALKIKESSYIHAEGFAGGELKHGVIALIEKGTPCICVVANDRAKESTLSNAMELKSRGAKIIGIAPENNNIFDEFIKVGDVGTASPIVSVVPMQLLAYFLAVSKGLNPDRPRNLAKSVTVK